VAVSASTAREVERYYRLAIHAVVPNAVDTARFRPLDQVAARESLGLREDGRYALFLGRAEWRKGVDLLEGALRGHDIELLSAGGTITGAVNLGRLQPDQVVLALNAADVFLFPTRYEGCSYAVLEAIACNLPVATTAAGWGAELRQMAPAPLRPLFQDDPADIGVAVGLALRTGREQFRPFADDVRAAVDLDVWKQRWAALLGIKARRPDQERSAPVNDRGHTVDRGDIGYTDYADTDPASPMVFAKRGRS
jgi:hypothetical protein